MSHAKQEKSPWIINSSSIGVAVLVLTFIGSVFISVRNTLRIERPEKPIIYIAHWQLEKGYREAMQHVIDDYNKLHPETEIKQMGVTERVYGQWLNTQLISGTAPDLCEMGMAKLAQKDEYTVRYFLPLSSLITKPNPYNTGTELEKTPWKETLLDGMRGGYREGLQEYFGVPTTLTQMRLYYNKSLLQAATGSDAPPQSFGQWMAQCEQIRQYANTSGKSILPVVSCYSISTMQYRYEPAFTSSFEPDIDLDLNGEITPMETYIAYVSEKVSLNTPAVRAMHELLFTIGQQMQKGFVAMDRQQAQYRFVNELAGFMWTGSWDASGTISQASAQGFEVGVVDLPLPAKGEKFGEYVRGRASEAVSGAGVYGVYKQSKNADKALDFLMYLTSQKVNEKLNRESAWPPLTIGAEPSEVMRPFTANLRGYNTRLQFALGSRVAQEMSSSVINYFQGDATYDSFVADFTEAITDVYSGGDWGWWFEYDTARRDIRNKDRILAQQQLLDLINPDQTNKSRYQRGLLQQVSRNNALNYTYLFKKYRDKDLPEY